MSRYRSSGGLDDAVAEDGDRAFLGVQGRLEPDQLNPGQVAISENGRMDRGVWQPRRGIKAASDSLEITGNPVTLPFFLADAVGGNSISAASRVNQLVTVTANRAGTGGATVNLSETVTGAAWSVSSLNTTGATATANLTFSSGLSAANAGQLISIGGYTVEFTVSSSTGPFFYPTIAIDPFGDEVWTASEAAAAVASAINGATGVSDRLAVNASALSNVVTIQIVERHGMDVGLSGYVKIEGLTGSVSPNGTQLITVNDNYNFTFEIDGATGSETYGGTGVYRSVLDDTAVSTILGSCLFSDPAQESAESVVIAANGKAFAVDVATGNSTDIDYPTGSTLSGEVDLIQAFDRVTLFRKGAQAWEWYGTQGRAVTSAVLASNVVTVTLKDHGLTTGDPVVLSNIGYVTTDPNGTRAVTGTPTADTFTFALTGANETFTAGTGTAVTGFTKVRAGAFTQPQVFEVTAANANVVSGLATFTVSGNTTITAGDTIRIYDATDPHFIEFIGKQFSVIAATSTTVQFYIPVADHTGSGHTSEHVSIGKEVSIGAGFMNMPAPPWGVYHQRRMWVPFWYSQTGTTASPTFTDRKIRDEIAVSDILDNLTYDQIANQFRITAGIADFTVAMQPFYEDAMIVFNRNSLHLVSGVSGGLSDTTVNELTREIGCLARKSIAQRGPEILFLSDNGVYSVSFLDQYNLRGVDLPLSDAIQPTIDRINRQLAANAVGAYFDNRYFLAVPLDSAVGAGDATGNNAILVYNFLNKAWESVDSVGDSRWNILNFHIARSGDRNDLYAVNDLGGLHKIDATDDDVDELSIVPGKDALLIPISSRLVTRRYTMGDLGRKRFSELQIQVESGNSMASDGALSVSTEDPDEESATTVISSSIGELLASSESASIRSRVGGLRGHGASVEFTPTAGRPKLRSVRISATSSNRATVDQK